MALRKPVKYGLILALVGGGAFIADRVINRGAASVATVDLAKQAKGELKTGFEETEAAPAAGASAILLPTAAPAAVPGPVLKVLTIPWNGTQSLLVGIGGKTPRKGSVAEKIGLNITLERQDMYDQMQGALIACATDLAGGAKNCSNGANEVIIMGDAAPGFLEGLNTQLVAKVGAAYEAEIIVAAGRSDGEDKCMLPPEMKKDPKLAKGALIAGVLKDGDWNLCIHWARVNQIPNNPDVTTYDPDAINWVGTGDFKEADEKYIAGYCEDRREVKNGQKTGETKHACVNGVATWTPGDVVVAQKKGGLVSVLSTRENDSQMAATVIGLRKFHTDNEPTVLKLIELIDLGGIAIKTGGMPALMAGGKAAVDVFGEETPQFWAKYYKGVEEMDATGNMVSLGGSKAWSVADNVRYFGLDGGMNWYAETYNLFGHYMQINYPNDLPKFPPVAKALNLRYLQKYVDSKGVKDVAEAPDFTQETAQAGELVAAQDVRINFQTGSAAFAADAGAPLKALLGQLAVSGNTVVEIHGHTDNTGTPAGNMVLSQQRADAVRKFLLAEAKGAFPENRFKVVAHGQTQPLPGDANSASGRAANRRVQIVLKSR